MGVTRPESASVPAPGSRPVGTSGAMRLSYLLAAALLCGAGIRFWLKLDSGLWEDEVIAVTLAVQPLP